MNGIKGIEKKEKDNGVLVLYSLERDAGGGSMRIEVGRELEGNITDGTAGAILDSYNDGVRDFNLHIRTFPNNMFNENGFLGAKAWVMNSILNMKLQLKLEI